MELSNELKQYMDDHSEGLVLREVPDELLMEMLAKATECVAEKDGKELKGTSAFQTYFSLDMSYTSAYQEPERRGYKKLWCKDDVFYDVNTGKEIESASEVMQECIDTEDIVEVDMNQKKSRQTFSMNTDTMEKWAEFTKEAASKSVLMTAACELFMSKAKEGKVEIKPVFNMKGNNAEETK